MDTSSRSPASLRDAAHAEWRACVAAFTFLTRIPAYRLATHDGADLPGSAAYFPVVGLAVALAGGIAYLGASHIWPAPIAIVLSVATTVWITGAFHEDALADSFDGFGGGWNRDQVLAIMKDSRVGSYALVGVVLVLIAKIVTLAAIADGANSTLLSAPGAVTRALIAGHVLGRWSGIPLISHYDYVRQATDGERASAGKPFVSGVSVLRTSVATALAFAIVIVAIGWKAPVVLMTAVIVTALGGRYARRRIGGITGDVLGAINQFVELSVYLVLAAHLAFA